MGREVNMIPRILAYGYESVEHHDYPFGQGCYYAQRWHEIENVYFRDFVLCNDDKYREYPIDEGYGYTIEEIAQDVYWDYKEAVKTEANTMDADDEIKFLMKEPDFSGSSEDIAWINFWVHVTRNMEKEYRERETKETSTNAKNTNV